jgi:hypothetical protein
VPTFSVIHYQLSIASERPAHRELIDLILSRVQLPEAQPHRLIFDITGSTVMRDTAH